MSITCQAQDCLAYLITSHLILTATLWNSYGIGIAYSFHFSELETEVQVDQFTSGYTAGAWRKQGLPDLSAFFNLEQLAWEWTIWRVLGGETRKVVGSFQFYSKWETKLWIYLFIHYLLIGHLMYAEQSRHWEHHSKSKSTDPLPSRSLHSGYWRFWAEKWHGLSSTRVLLATVWSITCRGVRTVAGRAIRRTATIQTKECRGLDQSHSQEKPDSR